MGYNYTVGSITNCYHAGAVTGSSTGNSGIICAGGVAGENLGTVTNCYHGTGTVTGTGTAGDRCVGGVVGLVGFPNSGTVSNCYFLQDQNINNGLNGVGLNNANRGTVENVAGKTAAEFASGEVAWLLQNGQDGTVWVQKLGTGGDSSPVLAAFSPDTLAVHRVTFTAGETTDPTYYRNTGGTVTAPALPADTDYAGWYDGDTKYEAEATITVGNSDIAVVAKTQESTPNIDIDYGKELLTGFADGAAYTIDGEAVTLDENNTLSVEEYMGKAVSIVRKSASETSVDSEPQTLTIPARPAAPSGFTGVNETFENEHDGKITGVTTSMEYKLSTDTQWTACDSTGVTGLAPGEYQVRTAATNDSFASTAANVTIAIGAAPTYTLNVTAPTFDTAAYGTQPDAKAITISNSGNSASAISGVALSGNTSAFTLNKTDGATVQPGAMDNTTYTIQPAAGLGAGTYTATITVTYQDSETAMATVSFTVTQAAQEAPAAPELDSRTTSSITLKTVDPNANGAAAEYGISTDGGETWAWQASPEFTGLASGTEYTFAVRYGATENGNYAASPASNAAAFSTTRPSIVVPVTPTYPPAVEDADNGTVSVTPANPRQGSTVTVTPNPDKGYEVASVTVTDSQGNPVAVTDNGDGTYSFTQPAGKVTVEVTFTEIPKDLPFTDVPENAYYYDAVAWAVENGVTAGTMPTMFSPDAPCTRAQAVTFLWRAAGSPAPQSGANPFTDVQPGAYYYEAVLWAVENGVTEGTTPATFSPDQPCVRAQTVTFLWRAAGSPAPKSGANPFTDVQPGAYYYDAVLWAVENGVTAGTTPTTFSPGGTCVRAQIATFLYRVYA